MNLNLIFTELRADITFTPTISLQTYLRPYYYTADFENYKMFSESRTFNFQPIDSETDAFYSSNYDLDNKTLQGNAVLRWEYTPGSTLFLVWEQTRDVLQLSNANFEAYNGVVDTFRNKPVNIFLLKLSYWFGN